MNEDKLEFTFICENWLKIIKEKKTLKNFAIKQTQI